MQCHHENPTALVVILRYDTSADRHDLHKNQMLSGLQVFDRSDQDTTAGKARRKILRELTSSARARAEESVIEAAKAAQETSGATTCEDSDDTKPIATLMREMRSKTKREATRVHVRQMSTQIQEYIAAVGFVASVAESGSDAALCLKEVQFVVDECHQRHAHKFLKMFNP
jgi:hypothetical protein